MTKHTPVLLHESIDGLGLKAGDIFLDGTFGGGGHSSYVLKKYPEVKVIALDQDQGAISRFQETNPNLQLVNKNFRNLDEALEECGVGNVDAILLDLGISSDQLDTSGRGFSFQRDEPLDMRMSASARDRDGGEGEVTAADILNTFSEETLELIIRGFGEEKYSRKIAKAIVEARVVRPFQTTFDLVDTVLAAVPAAYSRGRIHAATRTFQALRIATNEELTALEEGLQKGFDALDAGGRLAVISFHSLEDRIVKNFFRDKVRAGEAEFVTNPSTKLRTGKPIVPTEEEIDANPRSRSAKLRIIKKI